MTITTRRRGHTDRYRSAGGQAAALQGWLQRRCRLQLESGNGPLRNVRPIRTSSETLTLWLASARTSFAAADRSDPDVAHALALGFDVVRRDAIGETTRRQLGDSIFVVRMHHVPGGLGGRQLGVILHVGNTLFVYLLASARANNLQAESDDRRGNAATEVLSTLVRAMWAVGRESGRDYRPQVYAREHDRIVRDERHGADLKATFVSCRVVAHTPHTTDLTKQAEAQHFSFGSMLSAGAADSAIRGMNRAEIVIQAGGGYYESIGAAPFTHGPRVVVERDTRTGIEIVTTDIHQLAFVQDVDSARAKLRTLVDTILKERATGRYGHQFADWAAVGELMAELGLPSRLPAHLRRGLLLSELGSGTREAAAKSLFSERWISGWRQGWFEKLVPIKIAMELDLSDLDVEETETADGRPAFRCRIKMPVPKGGWGISDEEWENVLAARYPLKGRPRRHTGNVLPLAGLPPWQVEESGCQYGVETKSPLYVLRSRRLAEALHPDGSHRGWDDCQVTRVAGVRAKDLHADLGRAMSEALLPLDADVAPVVLAGPSRARAGNAEGATMTDEAIRARRAELTAEVELAGLQLDGATDTRNLAKGRHTAVGTPATEKALERSEAACERAEQRLTTAETSLAALQDRPSGVEPAPLDHMAWARTATAEFVAVALGKCVAGAPGWLQEACEQLLSDVRLVPVKQPGTRPKVAWSATLTLDTVGAAGEHTPVCLPLQGEVFERTNARDDAAGIAGPGGWAWAYFYRGLSFAEVGRDGDIDGSGKKNSYLYKGLTEWLATVAREPDLRAAALDCPVPATRRVLYSAVTADTAVLAGIGEGFASHVRSTYEGAAVRRRWGWCGDTHQLARGVAQLLLAEGGSAPLPWLAQQLGAAPSAIAALARENGKPIKGGEAQKPAPVAVSPFTKNWSRGGRPLEPDQKRLSLRPCPHKDCPGRRPGSEPFASHVLAVPETEAGHGVLCPACLRLPVVNMRRVYFPADYLRPWSGRFGHGSHAAARNQSGSHIDTMFPDPGPAAELPEPGVQPRPETRVNNSGEYVPRHLRTTPLGGRRVLALDLTDADDEAVRARVAGLGGRLAHNVKASLLCLVVPEVGCVSGPKVDRARRLGVEVLTLGAFAARDEHAWTRAAARDVSAVGD